MKYENKQRLIMPSVKITPKEDSLNDVMETDIDLRNEEAEEREEDQILGEKERKRKAFDEVYEELYEHVELGAFDIIFCPKFQGIFFSLAAFVKIFEWNFILYAREVNSINIRKRKSDTKSIMFFKRTIFNNKTNVTEYVSGCDCSRYYDYFYECYKVCGETRVNPLLDLLKNFRPMICYCGFMVYVVVSVCRTFFFNKNMHNLYSAYIYSLRRRKCKTLVFLSVVAIWFGFELLEIIYLVNTTDSLLTSYIVTDEIDVEFLLNGVALLFIAEYDEGLIKMLMGYMTPWLRLKTFCRYRALSMTRDEYNKTIIEAEKNLIKKDIFFAYYCLNSDV